MTSKTPLPRQGYTPRAVPARDIIPPPGHRYVPRAISADDVVAASTLNTHYDRSARAWCVPDHEWKEFHKAVLTHEDAAVESFTTPWRVGFALALAVLVIGGSLLLSGCAGPHPGKLQQLRSMGATEAQIVGYQDGCLSGESAAGYVYARFQKDFKRYDADDEYRSGWDQGYDFCAKRMSKITGRF